MSVIRGFPCPSIKHHTDVLNEDYSKIRLTPEPDTFIDVQIICHPFNVIHERSELNYKTIWRIMMKYFHVNINEYSDLNKVLISFILWNNMIERGNPFRVEKCYEIHDNTSVDWSELNENVVDAIDRWCQMHNYQSFKKFIPEKTKFRGKECHPKLLSQLNEFDTSWKPRVKAPPKNIGSNFKRSSDKNNPEPLSQAVVGSFSMKKR